MKQAQQAIAQADTPTAVWELVLAIVENPNGYSDATIVRQVRDYADIALVGAPR